VTGVKKCVTCADTSVLDHALCKRPNYLFGRVPSSRAPLTRVPRPRFGIGKWRLIQKDPELGDILRLRSNVDLKVHERLLFSKSSCSLTLSRHRTNGGICTLRAVAPRRS